MALYALKFRPIFKRRIWGGRRLEHLFGKALPPDEPIGESWELVDLEHDQSVVAEGPAAGRTLHDLLVAGREELAGPIPLAEGRFPLLLKFLDACDDLSVQVHPTEEVAARMGGEVRVKHEAWYVIHADPGAGIYHGLHPGVSRESLREACRSGEVARLLRRVEVRPGQCYYLPSGTVHALGRGVVVAEIQTPSDTTFRLFDWNRIDPATGRPRELHIEQALECITFDAPAEPQQPPTSAASAWLTVTRLAACEAFVVEKIVAAGAVRISVPVRGPMAWMVLEGRGVLYPPSGPATAFQPGDTLLLPAGIGGTRLQTAGRCQWLEVTFPAALGAAALAQPGPSRAWLDVLPD